MQSPCLQSTLVAADSALDDFQNYSRLLAGVRIYDMYF